MNTAHGRFSAKSALFAVGALFTIAVQASPIVMIDVAIGQAPARAAETAFFSKVDQFRTEDFETFTARTLDGSFATKVGTFTSTGASGNPGNSKCIGNAATGNCDQLAILDRATSPFSGRFNTTVGGNNWLDSNDVSALTWEISAQDFAVNALGFFLTDVSDQGAQFRVRFADGGELEQLVGLGNGELAYLSIFSNASIVGASLIFENFSGRNTNRDGFGIDDVTVARQVPEPSTLALFGFALLAFGVSSVGRRRSIARQLAA